MCGTLGIIGVKNAADYLYTGLFALQHRGQDSAGILTLDGNRVRLKKDAGLVGQVFDKKTILKLDGSMGVGQVRYATVGSSKDFKRDAQPFMVKKPVLIGISHNGNTVNYDALSKGYSLESGCDVELILKIFAKALSKELSGKTSKPRKVMPENVFNAVEAVMKTVNGAYAVIAVIKGVGLLGFRDPHAIKPFVFGKKQDRGGKGYAFASESVALDAMGFKLVRDVGPGEAILVDLKGRVHEKTILAKKKAHCYFEWVYFARPDSVIEGKSVYEARRRLGKQLATHCGECRKSKKCIVVPVPDTSRPAASALAEELGKPVREGLIKNRYIGRTFIMPLQRIREAAVTVKMNPMKQELQGNEVLLVDDSIVRGTTSKKLVALVKPFSEKTWFLSTCPPISSPCFYGIDFPSGKELIANRFDVKGIRKQLGADWMVYQTIQGLRRAIGLDDELCMACLTGNYPTPVTLGLMKALERSRKKERGE